MESPRTRPVIEGFFNHFFSRTLTENANKSGSAALKAALQQRVLVLTPNDRLATRLSQAYVDWLSDQAKPQSVMSGSRACAMPTFVSLTRWSQQQWMLLRAHIPDDHELSGRVQLLCAQSEWVLWEKLVSQTAGLSLLDERGLATLAQEAYAIQRAWQIKTREIQAHAQGDQRYFVQWQAAFVEECATQAVLSRADVLPALLALPAQVGLPLTQCCWLGFSELTPAETALFEAMPKVWQVQPVQMSLRDFVSAAAGVQHAMDDGMNNTSSVQGAHGDGNGWGQTGICQVEDDAQEVQAALTWLRQRYDKNVKLALVVPDLPTRKASLERAFQSEWGPAWAPQALLELPDASLTDAAMAEWVSFSGGTALAELPLYAVVRALLAMTQGQVGLPQLAVLLTSPYVCSPLAERGARQRFLQALQNQQLTHWSLASALDDWQAAGLGKHLAQCPDWVARFESCVRDLDLVSQQGLTPPRLDALLAAWGWPGDRAIDSAEYQQLKRWGGVRQQWQEMLQFRETLEGDAEAVSLSASAGYLQEILAGQIFQPKSQDTPLQVLGILEALEQPFDALWFMGAEDQVLPPAARPHPLLPQSLQRHYNSLRATPGRELALARETVRAFSALTWETCFSWSSRVGNREAAPSRLIAHLPELWSPDTLMPAIASPEQRVFELQVLPCEEVQQTRARPVGEPTAVRGGTGVMKTFAECPFKAYIRYRLGLDAPATPSLGLDAVIRGVLVHAVLEAVWQHLERQSALLALTDSAREALVQEKVSEVLRAFTAPEGLFLGAVLLPVEAKRLVRTVLRWLTIEAKRAPFRVQAIEKALVLELAGLRLNVRLDRMDETEDGDLLVIDYKTGQTDVGQWFGKRIQAPQLPLYCTALAPKARGVIYGVVKASKPQVKGVVAENVWVMQDSKDSRSVSERTDWAAIVAMWQKTLEKTAADFVQGMAAVDPIDGTKTCERCAYASVCRINARVQAHAKTLADTQVSETLSVEV